MKEELKNQWFKLTVRGNSLQKAISWVKRYRIPNSGIVAQHKTKTVTPEVTGYLIPTLYNAGEKELAYDLAKWEASIQRPDGSFVAPGSDVPYSFDTAQIARGFLAVMDDRPEFEKNLRLALDYVERYVAPDGKVLTDSYDMWLLEDGTTLSEYGNLYNLPPLLEGGIKLNEPRYIAAARRGMDYFRKKSDLVEFKPQLSMLSHYFGYMMEALVDLGETDLAKKGLEQALALQRSDGSIPAYPGVDWVCATGMAQLAIAWYKLGINEPADKAMAYLEKIQNPSGGFYGGYGQNVNYFNGKEIPWAVKFFIDAYLLRIKADFNVESSSTEVYPQIVKDDDGRVQAIKSFLGDLNNKKVIDIGCGKGRFIKVLQTNFPKGEYYGIDISEEMLKHCPPGVQTSIGNMLNIKYPDNYFDCVFTIEALEHAINIETAIKEMVRILKPGGKIVIIDKNIDKLGAMVLKPWEK